jgi:adenylate kinase
MKRLILFGAPGSGKGTIADYIQRDFKYLKISTGDIIREEIQQGSIIGGQVKEIMEKGDLIPDAVVVDLVRKRLLRNDFSGGYIMDGFPRTIAQAEALSTVAVELEKAIFFAVSEEVAIERLLSRLTCKKCGAIYNLKNKLPKKNGVCDLCHGEVGRRADDNEQTVKHRIKVYFEQTMPVIEYYQRKNVLSRIDGCGTAAAVYEELKKLIA